MAHQNEGVEHWERKLREALAISEYHFRDVVEEMVEKMYARWGDEDF